MLPSQKNTRHNWAFVFAKEGASTKGVYNGYQCYPNSGGVEVHAWENVGEKEAGRGVVRANLAVAAWRIIRYDI
jgi:hypothetical protein